jgi:hypothetical protein
MNAHDTERLREVFNGEVSHRPLGGVLKATRAEVNVHAA